MPLTGTIREDKLLSNVSIKYRQENFVAERIFPIISVKAESDKYRIYERNFRLPETRRAIGGRAQESSFEVSSASFVLHHEAQKDYIPDEKADNYEIGDLRVDTVEELTDLVSRRLELDVLSLFNTSGNWSLNVSLAAANAWAQNTTVSNPIPVADTAATTVIRESGKGINYCLMRRDAFTSAKNHTSVLDRVKHTSKEVDKNIIAALFGLPEIMVSDLAYDSSQQGVATSLADFMPNNAFFGFKPPSPGLKRPSAGYIFMKSMASVRRWRDDERKAEAIEVEKAYDQKIVASLCGYLVIDVT